MSRVRQFFGWHNRQSPGDDLLRRVFGEFVLTCNLGSFDDFDSVTAAFEGVYGAFVNTDGFTVGEQKEIYAGMRIFEIAKMAKTVRHYVYSNLDYALKVG